MDIDSIPAGRQMDSMIADKVFGYIVSYPSTALKDGEAWRGVPAYSTDISDAWKVVDKLRETCCDFSISEGYNAAFLKDEGVFAFTHVWVVSTADTVPVAICRAALKAVMGE